MLFEDAHLLALDKPPLLLTSPDRRDPQRPSLLALLHRGIAGGAAWARARQLVYLATAYCLDAEASGLLLLATTKAALAHLANQFGSLKPTLTCLALVRGAPPAGPFEVNAPLAPDSARPGQTRVDTRHGKKSVTRFRTIESFRGYALLEAQPLTARRHQVRVHLCHAGFPVVGDALYGGAPLRLSQLKPGYRPKPRDPERPLLEGAALHAERLTIIHPGTSDSLTLTAPWPKDLLVAVKYLRRFAPSLGVALAPGLSGLNQPPHRPSG